MKAEKGSRVILVEQYNIGIFSSIKKGTKGIIIDVITGFLSNTYVIKFENDEVRFSDSQFERYCEVI